MSSRFITGSILWFILFAILGTWQLHLFKKNEALSAIADQKLNRRPIQISAQPDTIKYTQCCDSACKMSCNSVSAEKALEEFTKVRVNGRLDIANEIRIKNKFFQGKTGYYVITPLLLENGHAVLVNRGWVDAQSTYGDGNKKNADSLMAVTGIVLNKNLKGGEWSLLENRPETSEWTQLDIDTMIASIRKLQGAHAPSYFPFIIQQTEDMICEANQPLPIMTPTTLDNNHLAFTILWYSLALLVVIIFGYPFFKKYKL